MSSTSTIHIIGAGLSGLAAALIAAEAGHNVILYEASAHAGGRCRSFYDKKLKTTIDNGNHLVMGANSAVLGYLTKLGTLSSCVTTSKPVYPFIDLATRHHWHFAPPRFKGIPKSEWLHLLKLILPAKNKTVSQAIPEHTVLYKKLIEPFTLAVLNTSPKEASAALLGQLMHQLAKGGRAAWQPYVPSQSLSHSFVDPALLRIKTKGGKIHYNCAVQHIDYTNGRATMLHTHKQKISLDEKAQLIIASPAKTAMDLLPEIAADFHYSPIINAHFMWPQAGMFRDNMPFLGVINGTVQWIFFHNGRISTTTSAANALVNMPEAELAQLLWHDVCRALYLDNAAIPPYRVIKEKRATYTASPDIVALRPQTTTSYSNVFLAGDYLASPLPATLEAAIRSGFAAASLAIDTT
ncbi:MAG: hydroxysqualene dehydroxylase HpnE [Alphaproteobacteria bacterium]|nr:hydroxysqualene dehydroxylase HpnE [Alphaproteobacteria bacterium]